MALNEQLPLPGIEWEDIPGYEGLYQVSASGQVRRLAGLVFRPQGSLPIQRRILQPRMKNSGYWFVTLSKNNVRRNHYIHHLVALLFVGERPARHDINHINGNKLDNRVSNLEYVTRAQNMEHARAMGLHNNCADGHYNAKLNTAIVRDLRYAYDKCGLRGEDLAEDVGVSIRCINDVLDRKTWKSVQ